MSYIWMWQVESQSRETFQVIEECLVPVSSLLYTIIPEYSWGCRQGGAYIGPQFGLRELRAGKGQTQDPHSTRAPAGHGVRGLRRFLRGVILSEMRK